MQVQRPRQAFADNALGQPLRSIILNVEERHPRTLTRKLCHKRSADSACSAGDENSPVSKTRVESELARPGNRF